MVTELVSSATFNEATLKPVPLASSSTMVTVLVLTPRVVLETLLRRTWKVSLVASWRRLLVISMSIVLVVSPTAKERVPLLVV